MRMLCTIFKTMLVGWLMIGGIGVKAGWAEEGKIRVKAESLASGSQAVIKDDSHVLEPGDRVRVKIYPEDQYIKGSEMDVSSEGNITLPLVGKVQVAGMDLIRAENELVKVIDAEYIVNPEVVIEMVSGKKKIFNLSILGEVKKPGSYEVETTADKLFLLEAISTAGGFSDIANIKKIKIMRKKDGKNEVIHANAENIISGKDSDVVLAEGDVVHVSESFF